MQTAHHWHAHAVVCAARSHVVPVGAEARPVPVHTVGKAGMIQSHARGVRAQVNNFESVVAAVRQQLPLVLGVAANAGDGGAVQASDLVHALPIPAKVPNAHNVINVTAHGPHGAVSGQAKIIDG